MEEKINVAGILKDKPQGTKLYDLLRNIDVELYRVHLTVAGDYIECISTNEVGSTLMFDYSKLGTEKCWLDGLQILLPSKGMRDWEKFSWEKGDVLISDCGFVCIFKEWASDDYTKFNGCYFDGMPNAETAKYSKLDNNTAYGYIRELENRCGGKLNLKTLEIEKTQPEFKDGDILSIQEDEEHYHAILIFKGGTDIYVYFDYFHRFLTYGTKIDENEKSISHLATDEEKQQLFSALKKENKAWDADKKMFVDLKPKVELKPFDRVLVRDSKSDNWRANLFGYIGKDGYYHCVYANWAYCIPYIGNESLLGTTKDVEG